MRLLSAEIFAWNLPACMEKLVAISNKAKRFNQGDLKVMVSEPYDVRENGHTYEKVLVEVTAPEFIGIRGWKFCGVVQHGVDESGKYANIVAMLPNKSIPNGAHEWSPICEHCNTLRNRKDTFLIENVDGRIMRVGRNCLADFGGLDAEFCLLAAMVLHDAREVDWDSGDGFYGASAYSSLFVYVLTKAAIDKFGWCSRKMGEENMIEPTYQYVQGQIQKRDIIYAQETWEFAKEVREWAKRQGGSDYMKNCSVIANRGYVEWRDFGLACATVQSYIRFLFERDHLGISVHFLSVGDKFGNNKKCSIPAVEAKITKRFVLDTVYGPQTVIGFRVGESDLLWFASGKIDAKVDDVIMLTGTVKEHSQDKKNGSPVTIVTRCTMRAMDK